MCQVQRVKTAISSVERSSLDSDRKLKLQVALYQMLVFLMDERHWGRLHVLNRDIFDSLCLRTLAVCENDHHSGYSALYISVRELLLALEKITIDLQ